MLRNTPLAAGSISYDSDPSSENDGRRDVSVGEVHHWLDDSETGHRATVAPDTWAVKFESLERVNYIHESNGSFDSCNSCKGLGTFVYMS